MAMVICVGIVSFAAIVCVAMWTERPSRARSDEQFDKLNQLPQWTWKQTRREAPKQPPAPPACSQIRR